MPVVFKFSSTFSNHWHLKNLFFYLFIESVYKPKYYQISDGCHAVIEQWRHWLSSRHFNKTNLFHLLHFIKNYKFLFISFHIRLFLHNYRCYRSGHMFCFYFANSQLFVSLHWKSEIGKKKFHFKFWRLSN